MTHCIKTLLWSVRICGGWVELNENVQLSSNRHKEMENVKRNDLLKCETGVEATFDTPSSAAASTAVTLKLPSKSLTPSAFNQESLCNLVAMLLWLIRTLSCLYNVFCWLAFIQKGFISTCLWRVVSMPCLPVSMTQRKTRTARKTCADTLVSWLYLGVYSGAACYLRLVCGAARTRPQLRYGNRCHNLSMALIQSHAAQFWISEIFNQSLPGEKRLPNIIPYHIVFDELNLLILYYYVGL